MESYLSAVQTLAQGSQLVASERGRVVTEIMAKWDAMLKLHPELQLECDIAMAWLTKTFTVEELYG